MTTRWAEGLRLDENKGVNIATLGAMLAQLCAEIPGVVGTSSSVGVNAICHEAE